MAEKIIDKPVVEKKKSSALTISLAIVLSAAVFGYIGYWYGSSKNKTTATPTPTVTATTSAVASATTTTDPTASWKTYTSDSYGISFKYPSNWTLKEDTSKSCQSFVAITSPETKVAYDKAAAEIEGDLPISAQDISFSYCKTVQDADGNNPKKWTSFSDMINDKNYYHDQSKITFAGQTAYSVIEGGLLDYYTILMEKDGHIYCIGFGNRESKDKVSATENQILSTFKFTPVK
jgi:hypothetical protein